MCTWAEVYRRNLNMEDGAGRRRLLLQISSFVRIKPRDADPGGGTATAKRITVWDAETGGCKGVKKFS